LFPRWRQFLYRLSRWLAIEIRPSFYQAYNNLALLLSVQVRKMHAATCELTVHLQDVNQAADYFRVAVEINPGFAEAFNNLGGYSTSI
jgi:Tfp pilus assembly protein PilF